jgi:chemotaxis protein CheZ
MIPRATVSVSASAKAGGEEIEADHAETALYEKLGELTRFIDKTIKTISQFTAPMSATTEQLPDATTHLRDLRKLTEDGTHKVMQLVETVQDNHRSVFAQLDALGRNLTGDQAAAVEAIRSALKTDDKPLVEMITALSFQDLVAQRVNKLVTIIEDVEHKLLELVVVFGPYTKGAGKAEVSRASEMLKQLGASKSTSMNQDLADEILKQFGFN